MRQTVAALSFTLALLFSCSGNQVSDNDVEQRANAIIKLLDRKGAIETFKHWGYGTRGEYEIWEKLDVPTYGCFYSRRDTLRLSVGLIENFKDDFPYTIVIDTSKVHRVIFKTAGNGKVSVTGWTNFGRDTTITDEISQKVLFPTKDPFQHFDGLSTLKDSLQIVGTFYRPDLGNFIQFYLTNEHVLTYFPDTLEINPKFKDIWVGYFSRGKALSKNWNLRKLENPLDNG